MSKKKTRKQKKRFKLIAILLIMFAVFIFGRMLIGTVFKDRSDEANVDMIYMGKIEQVIASEGYIVREEEHLKAPFKGKYVMDVSDGQKVYANQKIGTVLKESSDDISNQLKSIDLDIVRIQQNKRGNTQMFSGDIAKVDLEIVQNLKSVVQSNNSNNMAEVANLKHTIDGLMQKKVSIVKGFNISDAYLNDLKFKREKIQEKLNMSTKEINTSWSGIISFNVDGYEQVLVPSNIRELTVDQLSKVKAKDIKSNIDNIVVDSEMRFAKVVKDIDYYIVTCISEKESEKFKIDDIIKIRINDIDKTIEGMIDYKSNIQSGKCIVAIKTDKAMSDIIGKRIVSVDLITNSFRGLKVPLKSLSDIDKQQMTAKLTIVKYGTKKSVDIQILGYDREFAVIQSADMNLKDGVSLYDTYLINPNKSNL